MVRHGQKAPVDFSCLPNTHAFSKKFLENSSCPAKQDINPGEA